MPLFRTCLIPPHGSHSAQSTRQYMDTPVSTSMRIRHCRFICLQMYGFVCMIPPLRICILLSRGLYPINAIAGATLFGGQGYVGTYTNLGPSFTLSFPGISMNSMKSPRLTSSSVKIQLNRLIFGPSCAYLKLLSH